MKQRTWLRHLLLPAVAVGLCLSGCNREPVEKVALTEPTRPNVPSNLVAQDHPWDKGEKIDLTWDLSEEEVELVDYFEIHGATMTMGDVALRPDYEMIDTVLVNDAFDNGGREHAKVVVEGLARRMTARELKKVSGTVAETGEPFNVGTLVYNSNGETWSGTRKYDMSYSFKVVAVGKVPAVDIGVSALEPSEAESVETPAIKPTIEWFDSRLTALFVIVMVIGLAVIYFILAARRGKPLKIRKIAGLEAIDEAVGRATEMGRSCLYIPGILDMNDIQTIASMTVLSHVAKTAAEYDAKVEVPTCRSLVMTSARETVQASFLAAGRPDVYNADLIYYVTDEQFGYVAYLQGMMTREKPAACFYMGAFFAESLILAETGNSIGAIQVAGTAMPAQLPFFVAACDYTLIGEEFFAASAYLSGEPDQLGSLKGQDVGKVIVAIGIIIGVTIATVATITGSEQAWRTLHFILDRILA